MKHLINRFVTILLLIYSLPGIAQVADKAENVCPLLVGEKVPFDSVLNGSGTPYSLADIIGKKPTVLVIFRGGWCPYCNVQLAGLAVAEEKILELGYQIVAVSPDDYHEISKIETKNEIKYQLYADKDARLITKMGLAFNSGGRRGILPVPSVMVLDQTGEILFEHINPNYKVRITSQVLLGVLQALKNNTN